MLPGEGGAFGAGQLVPQNTAAGNALAVRQAKVVEAQVVIAKRFHRNYAEVESKVQIACRRPKLAEKATYEYTRGGSTIDGPSIRLAEVLAQSMMNIEWGWVEIERREGSSSCEAFAWDLENNIRRTATFDVPHTRDVGKGEAKTKKVLTDDRDIYEVCANMAARRVRACLLNLIPGDLVDMALNECSKTLENNQEPLPVQAKRWIEAFKKDFSVPLNSLVRYLGAKWQDGWTSDDIHRLRKAYNSLHDNISTVEDFFPELAAKPINKEQVKTLLGLVKGKQEEAAAVLVVFGYERIQAIKEPDFDAIKAEFEKIAHPEKAPDDKDQSSPPSDEGQSDNPELFPPAE